MTSPAVLLFVPLMAVSFGYEPSSDADVGYDYTVQVEPELLEQMQQGGTASIEANIPREVTPIRRIRIVVGNAELPKKLRSPVTTAARKTAIESTAYREGTADANSTRVDLLAQTGPTGGYGRNSTGFSNGYRSSSQPQPTTVPPVSRSTTPLRSEIGQQLDAGFQSAETGAATAREAVRGSINNLGAAGQRAVDSGRQLISDAIAPPEGRSFDPQNHPGRNLAERAQNELRNTADAVRDSMDRTRETASNAFDITRFGNFDRQPDEQVGSNATSDLPDWNRSEIRDRYQSQDRSVLADNRATGSRSADNGAAASNAEANGGMSQEERELLERLRREQAAAERQATQSQQSGPAQSDNGLRFPEQPRLQPLPDRDNGGIVRRMVDSNQPSDPNGAGRNTGSSEESRQQSFAGDAWLTGGKEHFVTVDSQATAGFSAPSIDSSPFALNQSAGRPNVAPWLEDPQEGVADTEANEADPGSGSSTPIWLFGWAIAVGSVVTNLFQWLNIVDMRNKYRVALRRSSPNFSRSMAG